LAFSPSDRIVMASGSMGQQFAAAGAETGVVFHSGGTTSFGDIGFVYQRWLFTCRVAMHQKILVEGGSAGEWEESITFTSLSPYLDDSVTLPTGWRTMGQKPLNVPDVAIASDASRAMVATSSGTVMGLRPRRDGDWLHTWHPYVAAVAIVVLLGWSVCCRIRPTRPVNPATEEAALPQELPGPSISLLIISILLVVQGFAAIGGMIWGVISGSFLLDLTFLNIWAGRGIRKYRRGWRKWVLFQIWTAFILMGLMAGAMGQAPGLVTTRIKLDFVRELPPWCPAAMAAMCLALLVWVFCVLSDPATRALFERYGRMSPAPQPSEGEPTPPEPPKQ